MRVVVTTTPTEDAHYYCYYYYYYARVTSRVSFTSVLREKKRGARKKHQPKVKTSSNGSVWFVPFVLFVVMKRQLIF